MILFDHDPLLEKRKRTQEPHIFLAFSVKGIVRAVTQSCLALVTLWTVAHQASPCIHNYRGSWQTAGIQRLSRKQEIWVPALALSSHPLCGFSQAISRQMASVLLPVKRRMDQVISESI